MEFQVFAPGSMVTARNWDRSVFSAWGLRGGGSGRASRFAKNPDTDRSVELGSQDVVSYDPADVILIQGPGAGGYVEPLARPESDVLNDVRCGFVSKESAASIYGVAILNDGTIDAPATARLKGERGAAGLLERLAAAGLDPHDREAATSRRTASEPGGRARHPPR